MKLQQFDGGLSTRTRPQYLQVNEAVEYVNVDDDAGSLAPVKLPAPTTISSVGNPYWYDAEQEWLHSVERRDYVEFQGELFWTNRTGVPQRYDGTTQSPLGIAPPTSVSAALNGAGALTGTYQYVITYYNSANGSESGPTSPTAEVVADTNKILVTLPTSSEAEVDRVRIYRVGGNLAQFTLVTEVANGAASYDDNIADTAVDGRLLTTETALPAPTGLKYLTEAYAMLFGALGSKLRFTPIGEPDQWPELNFIDFEGDITGIIPVTGGVVVCTKFKSHIVTGTGPTSLAAQLLSGDQGCVAQDSVQVTGGTGMWISTDGLCASNGGELVVISRPKLGKLTLNPVDSAIYDEVYYCQDVTGQTFVFNYGSTKAFKWLDVGISRLAVANDVLYGLADGVLQTMFAGSDASLTYVSPRLIEGSASETKNYKDVFIYSKGTVTVEILLDDVVVMTRTLTTEDAHQLRVPQAEQRAFFIQFRITGPGEVYEIEYVAGDRKSG